MTDAIIITGIQSLGTRDGGKSCSMVAVTDAGTVEIVFATVVAMDLTSRILDAHALATGTIEANRR